MEVKKKNKVAKIVIILAIALILLGIVIAIFMNYNKEEKYNATFKIEGSEYDYAVMPIKDGHISLPLDPTKEGYVFLYWELNGEKYTGTEKVTGDVVLTAVFKEYEEEKVTVTFNKDNGEENTTTEVTKYGKVSAISEPTKEGYNFVGWYLDDVYFSFDTTPIEENITLTAKWETIVYIIKFDTKGGNKISDKVVEYKKQVKAPTSPTKEGYKFLGWYLNDKKYDFNTKVTKDITLVAKWEKNASKIVYGDVNEDGIIDTKDVLRVFKYLAKMETLSAQAKKNADVNDDKKVNHLDGVLISKQLSGWYDVLPNAPIKDYVSEGDLNDDGLLTNDDYEILNSHLSNNTPLSVQAKKNADVNSDGKINNLDLLNLQAKLNKLNDDEGNNYANGPITEYGVYGDTNNDDVVNSRDVSYLMEYLENKVDLDRQSRKNSDINGDGNINKVDYQLLMRYLSGWYENTLPKSQITDYVMYGDVNEDGIVDGRDSVKIEKYLANELDLSEQAKKNADVNDDGKVDNTDASLLLRYNGHMYENTLPNAPIKDYVMYGDVNEDSNADINDSLLLLNYLKNKITLSEQAKKNADVNGDGNIDNTDVTLILRYDAGWYENTLPNKPIKDYVMYGDVNEDGEINSRDTLQIVRHLNNEVELSAQAKKNADVNGDGQINEIDSDLLTKYIVEHSDGTIPSSPLS